jgi:hypothetical protein
MFIEATSLEVRFEHPKEKAFARKLCLTPRSNLGHKLCADALMLKVVPDMQVVEQGSQMWIFRAKGASESGKLIRDFCQHYMLVRLRRRQPLNPYSGSIRFEIGIQIFIAKHPSVGAAPTGCM